MASNGFGVTPDLLKSDFSQDTTLSDSVDALVSRIVVLENIVQQLINLVGALQSPDTPDPG